MGFLVEAVRWGAGAWLLARVPTPRSSAGTPVGTAVVVPARDEAANLAVLLPSLAGWPVVVVDDASTDGTAEVARAHGATVVAPGEPPRGWTGKAWACWNGARHTDAATLVFLDADTRVEPGGLERVLAEHRPGTLLSVQPYHRTERAHERLSAFFNVVAMMGSDAFTPLAARVRPSGAFGPCLVIDRATYDAIGGHEAVRSEVLDDVALAGLVPHVRCIGGRGAIEFRMYAGGLAQLVEGWTKNFASGAASTRPVTLVLVVAWLSGVIAAPVALVVSPSPLSAGVYAAYALQLAWMLARIGRFGLTTAALYPVPLAFFLGVFLRSVVVTVVRGRVRWKGREVPLR